MTVSTAFAKLVRRPALAAAFGIGFAAGALGAGLVESPSRTSEAGARGSTGAPGEPAPLMKPVLVTAVTSALRRLDLATLPPQAFGDRDE